LQSAAPDGEPAAGVAHEREVVLRKECGATLNVARAFVANSERHGNAAVASHETELRAVLVLHLVDDRFAVGVPVGPQHDPVLVADRSLVVDGEIQRPLGRIHR